MYLIISKDDNYGSYLYNSLNFHPYKQFKSTQYNGWKSPLSVERVKFLQQVKHLNMNMSYITKYTPILFP